MRLDAEIFRVSTGLWATSCVAILLIFRYRFDTWEFSLTRSSHSEHMEHVSLRSTTRAPSTLLISLYETIVN